MHVKEVLSNVKGLFVKRKYKDILFRFVFNDKKELLQLYNAINHTDYTNPNELLITTMEDVIYIGMKNDLSFLIANDLNLYEHQSTINYNMPLRGLLYLAKMYESYIETHGLNRYQRNRIRLPFPRYIVFYNGEEDAEDEMYMRLSDSFELQEEPAVECIARFININYGHNKELMAKCKRLHDYSYFIECTRKYMAMGYSKEEGIALAVNECIEKEILVDILVKHRAEVIDMFLTTFDKKMYKQAIEMEAREDGWNAGMEAGQKAGMEAGRKEGQRDALRSLVQKKLAKGKSPEVIAEEIEEDVATVEELIKEVRENKL